MTTMTSLAFPHRDHRFIAAIVIKPSRVGASEPWMGM
jgi:hypothetical protein